MDMKNVIRLPVSTKGLLEVCTHDFQVRLLSMICIFLQPYSSFPVQGQQQQESESDLGRVPSHGYVTERLERTRELREKHKGCF